MKGIGEDRWCVRCLSVQTGKYMADGDGEHLVCARCGGHVPVDESLDVFQRRVDSTLSAIRRRLDTSEGKTETWKANQAPQPVPEDASGFATAMGTSVHVNLPWSNVFSPNEAEAMGRSLLNAARLARYRDGQQ